MNRLKLIVVACFCAVAAVCSAQVIPVNQSNGGATAAIVGQIQTATGGTINHGTLTFNLSQPAVAVGTATLVTQPTACYTSTQGNVVGLPDPLVAPVLSVNTASGTLPAGTYFVVVFYFNSGGYVSAVSPESYINLGSQGTVNVNAPSLEPSGATGYGVAIGTSSGTETVQNDITGWTQYQQSVPLGYGVNPLAVNDSICNLYFSDQLIPTGTYYTVNLVNKNGSQVSGFPQTWCTYGGPSGTINVSQGAPTGNCNTTGVFYPTPVFASPFNASTQSVATPIAFPGGVVGNTIFTGATSTCNLNTVMIVGGACTNFWGGGDIGSQVNNAVAACLGTCEIDLPANAFLIYSTTMNVTSNGISIRGMGSRGTHLAYTGSGDGLFLKYFLSNVIEGGTFSNFTIDGSSAGNQTSCIHIASVNEVSFYNVTCRAFTGATGDLGTGLWMDDQAIAGVPAWSERVTFVNFLSYNNHKGIRFTKNGGTGSFARFHCIACYENIEQGQIGVSAEAGANVYDSTFDISGNIDDVPSSGGTLVSVDGTSVMEGDFNLRAESNVTIAHGGGTCVSLAAGAALYGRGAVDCSSSPGLVANSIDAAAHFEVVGGHDPLQKTFSNSGVGPWLIPNTVNAEEGLGLNARWDGTNWLCNGDGGHNGCGLIAGNAVDGEIGFYSIASTGTTNKSLSDATMIANKVAAFTASGISAKSLTTSAPSPFFAQGTTAMPTGLLGANACSSAVTVATTGVTTSMRVVWNLHSTPVGVTGYGSTPVDIKAWLTADNVNFIQCSVPGVTPDAMSVDWTVF